MLKTELTDLLLNVCPRLSSLNSDFVYNNGYP